MLPSIKCCICVSLASRGSDYAVSTVVIFRVFTLSVAGSSKVFDNMYKGEVFNTVRTLSWSSGSTIKLITLFIKTTVIFTKKKKTSRPRSNIHIPSWTIYNFRWSNFGFFGRTAGAATMQVISLKLTVILLAIWI